MDITTIQSYMINNTNSTCLTPLLWTQQSTDSRRARLCTCIVAAIIHAVFWLQLVLCSSVRQKSMQWIYAYLITGLLILTRFFFIYTARTRSTDCEPSQAWFLFVCYVDAVLDNYLNVLEIYILLALNICRHIQIAYNRNVYQLHKNLLIFAHVGIYLSTWVSPVIQFLFGWTELSISVRDSCQVRYKNIHVQVFNMITAYALPICLNILVIVASIQHVQLTSTLQRGQHHVSARQKYHRSLVIQFLIFYTIWVALWSPNVIVFQVSTGANLTAIVRLLNFIKVALDPFIIAALDVRFWQAWQKVWVYLKRRIVTNRAVQSRIQPTTTKAHVFSLKTPQLRTGAFHTRNM